MTTTYPALNPLPAPTNGPGIGTTLDARLDRLLKRAEAASGVKALWQPLFQDCYDYALPRRQGFWSHTEGEMRNQRIFDSTAVIGLIELASRLQAYVVPIYGRWMDLEAGTAIPTSLRWIVAGKLQSATDLFFQYVQNSNFDQAVQEFMLEYAIGSAAMVVDESYMPGQPFCCTPLSLAEFDLETGPYGDTAAIFRNREVCVRDVEVLWPDALIPPDLMAMIQSDPLRKEIFVEYLTRDYTAKEERWDHGVIWKSKTLEIWSQTLKGEGSCPIIVSHWARAPADSYGRGPVQNCLGDIKVLNLITELMLENAELAVVGMWQADHDGVINPDTIQLAPGSIIPKAMNSQGLQPLTPGGEPQYANFVLNEMRSNIKKALYDEPLGSMQDSRIQSAQEVVERMADLSRRVGSAFGRLQAEFVIPVVKRILYILKKRGLLKLPAVDGKQIRVRPISPLARNQAQEQVLALQKQLELIRTEFGPGAVNQMMKGEEVSTYIGDRLGVPLTLIRTPDEQKRLLATAASSMAQQGATPPEVMEQIV